MIYICLGENFVPDYQVKGPKNLLTSKTLTSPYYIFYPFILVTEKEKYFPSLFHFLVFLSLNRYHLEAHFINI